MEVNTDTRAGRMLEGLLGSDHRHAKMVVTVTLFGDERRLHQAFRFKTWDGRDGSKMLSVEVNEEWPRQRVLHVDVATGRVNVARESRDDKLLVYAAQAAWKYATEGTTPQPSNGRVEVVESSYCGRCGHTLTHPDSIELGIGPECAGRENRGETVAGSTRRKARNAAAKSAAAPIERIAKEVAA